MPRKLIIDARTEDNLEAADPSAATRQICERQRDIVELGFYQQSGGRGKQTQVP